MVNYGNQMPNKSMFLIDELTGDIYLADSHSSLGEYTFVVSQHSLLANDQGTDVLNKSTVVVEFVSTQDSIKPTFQQVFAHWNVSEDAHIGYLIGQLELTAAPINSTKLRIVGEGNANTYFKVDQQSGDVYLQRQLDYNLAPLHLLVVELSHSTDQPVLGEGQPASKPRCVVQVNVLDVNNNDPQFLSGPNCTLYKQSRSMPSLPIHYFVAVDDDSPEYTSIHYEIINGNQAQWFSLNSTTGALHMIASPDELNKEIFPIRIRVRAWDARPPQSDNQFGKAKRHTRRYTDQNFSVLADPLYWTSDSNDLVYFVEGSNRKSQFTFTMIKGTPMGAVVHNFKRLDFAEHVVFKLSPESENPFEIGQEDGILKTKERLNASKYSFTLLVSGRQSKLDDHTSIIIHMLDNPASSGPKIVASSCGNITVRENMAVPDLVRIFAVATQQNQSEIFFKIEGGSGSQLFSIDNSSGLISCGELDRELKSEHLLVISASDNSTPKRVDVCTVMIAVMDENDNLPVFLPSTPSTIEISEHSNVSSVLATIQATDADQGNNAKLIYKLSSDKSQMLDVNAQTGQLIFARDLPFTEKEWRITIVAEDSGNSRVLNAEKSIRIVDKRKQPQHPAKEEFSNPQFLSHQYFAVVAEGQPRGQFVAQLETSLDNRRSASLVYSIVAGNQDAAFEVDQFGRLVTAQELDAEIQSLYSLTVTATYSRVADAVWSPTSQTEVQVRVLNLNDNPPSFPPLRAVMMEETVPLGSLLTTIKANDVDKDSLLEYSLVNTTLAQQFEVGRFTGTIHLKQPLDYDVQTKHLLAIQVFDGTNLAQTSLTLELIDVNDNTPTFEMDFIQLEISISTPPNTTITALEARDIDSGDNGRVTYQLLNANNLFGIDSKTGALMLLQKLPKVGKHLLEIKASDHGRPALSSIATIQINLLPDDQLDQPMFKQQTYRFMVSEDFPSHLFFGQVTLLNASIPNCGFVVIGSNSSGGSDSSDQKGLDINPSGHLFLTSKLDRELQWELRERVGILYKCTTPTPGDKEDDKVFASIATIVVQVADANDNTPVFEKKTARAVEDGHWRKCKEGSRAGKTTAQMFISTTLLLDFFC